MPRAIPSYSLNPFTDAQDRVSEAGEGAEPDYGDGDREGEEGEEGEGG